MTAPTIILSTPSDWAGARQAGDLMIELGCNSLVRNWHPSNGLTPGALHLTHMHPGDLEDWGYDPQGIERRGWPCARDQARPRFAQAQAGRVVPALVNWLAACVLALLLTASWLLGGPDDHAFEQVQAQELEAAQQAEAARQAFLAIQDGSTGMFPCYWTPNEHVDGGLFMLEDGDTYPQSAPPALWKPIGDHK